MVLMPSECNGEEGKLARLFHGPYRVVAVSRNNAEVRLVDSTKYLRVIGSCEKMLSRTRRHSMDWTKKQTKEEV